MFSGKRRSKMQDQVVFFFRIDDLDGFVCIRQIRLYRQPVRRLPDKMAYGRARSGTAYRLSLESMVRYRKILTSFTTRS
jgi:hypothetical protein